MRYRSLLALLLPALLTPPARSDETQQNVREICRIEVAGTLMNIYNDISLALGQLSYAEQKVKDLRVRLLQLEKDYRLLEQLPPQDIPAFDVDERVVGLRFDLQTTRAQLLETETFAASHKKELQASEEKKLKFERAIKPVFDFSRVKQLETLGQPQLVRYLHVCSQYQLLCPLPRLQGEALRRLAPELSNAIPCERYSQIIGP